MDVREKLVDLFYDSNVKCDQKIGCLADDVMDIIAHYGTVQDGEDNNVPTKWISVTELALPEQDYYVLRNTETGMYFRGKGVNRWGKHFNQATVYRVKGTAEYSIKDISWHGEKAELVRIKIVEMPQPPKGE